MKIVSAGSTHHLEIGGVQVSFHRTLRLPEDGKTHALPPSLGTFPLRRVDDYAAKVPAAWREHGGVFFPLYQREAMWLKFEASKPHALKIAAGKVNAVSGKLWSETLAPTVKASDRMETEQDYIVAPLQPWLDGFNVGKGVVRQFVAMPLGLKYTVEAQVTGEEKFGGLQLLVFAPAKNGPADKEVIVRTDAPKKMGGFSGGAGGQHVNSGDLFRQLRPSEVTEKGLLRSAEMGLAQGGQMKQKIYDDPYGIDAWDQSSRSRVFVHIVNSEMWKDITGEEAPATPIDAQTYTKHGLPWFDLYDEGTPAVEGSPVLAGLKTVAEKDKEHSFEGQQDDSPVDESAQVKMLGVPAPGTVRDGKW